MPTERVAFVDAAGVGLFAGEPRPPRRGAAGAILRGAAEHRVGVDQRRIPGKAQRTGTAVAPDLGVGDVHPAAVRRGEDGAAIGRGVPRVGARRQRKPRAARHDARAEARGQAQTVLVGGAEGGNETVYPKRLEPVENRVERCAGGRVL